MKVLTLAFGGAALAMAIGAGLVTAQQPQPPQGPQPFSVGNRLGLPINPAADGTFNPMSSNVKVYGAIYSAESCSYDPVRNLIVVPNRSVAQDVQTNNGWVSLINHDGSVHTARWIGVQTPGAQRANMTPPLVLNEPSGSDIANGMFYVSDRDGGTSPSDPLGGCHPLVQHDDRRARRRGPRPPLHRLQRHRGRRRWDDLCDADGNRRPDAGPDDLAGLEDHARRHRLDLHSGRPASSAERHRLRPAGQHRGHQHRQQRGADVLAGWPAWSARRMPCRPATTAW